MQMMDFDARAAMEYRARKRLLPQTIPSYNSEILRLVSFFLNVAPDAIDLASVREIAESTGSSLSRAYAECLALLCGLESVGQDRAFFQNYFLPMICEQPIDRYQNDPYYSQIRIPHLKMGNWELTHRTLQPGEAFVCDDFLVTDDRRMIPQIGFFTQPFAFPAVLENGTEWMTLMPNEMVTTAEAVKLANGRVLTYGLGLGYFAYLASQKEEVTSVTVVERSPEVIDLFATHILPQFPHRDKITLVCRDAFAFAEHEMTAGRYRFVFTDIWHDVGDGKPLYLKMKAYESRCPGTVFAYWLENSIRCYLDDCLFSGEITREEK